MAKKIESKQQAMIVKNYRIQPLEFKKADAACRKKYKQGLSSIVRQLISNEFLLEKK